MMKLLLRKRSKQNDKASADDFSGSPWVRSSKLPRTSGFSIFACGLRERREKAKEKAKGREKERGQSPAAAFASRFA